MTINPEVAREVRERLLNMCTHDCGSFFQFRDMMEKEHPIVLTAQLDPFFKRLNEILKSCGAPLND